MKMKLLAASLTGALLTLGAAQTQAFDNRVTVGAIGGTTGVGADVSWRFHERLGVSTRYTGGLDWDGDYDTEEANYSGDVSLAAGALKLDYYPFAGRFFLTVGAMLPDMEANVTGRAKENGDFEFDGTTYTASDVGTLNGQLTIADGVQPYAGLGWRSSHESGFGFFSEVGVMATNVDVSLSSSENYEANNATFRDSLRREEQRLEDEADELSVYPVAVIGISYTF
ncbi:hypothetical protein [Halomonas sp. NO4]|uniref:hypothetical protein n=1 Tax=Halomonas sp. NO4 TaxID=2484813 RepID=UPI001F08DF2F|nr:hypothetical protein [Halomonas sp. NO4]